MKLLGTLCLLVVGILALVALVPGPASSDSLFGTDYEVRALGTPGLERVRFYKSYPAPTGAVGFRKYYQKRCYPGCHYGNPVITPPTLADTHELPQAEVSESQPARPRYYKSYPAPTGQAGFRKYYQKRCYPGCHYGSEVVVPEPTAINP
jgi:hypothetical protein